MGKLWKLWRLLGRMIIFMTIISLFIFFKIVPFCKLSNHTLWVFQRSSVDCSDLGYLVQMNNKIILALWSVLLQRVDWYKGIKPFRHECQNVNNYWEPVTSTFLVVIFGCKRLYSVRRDEIRMITSQINS